MKSTIKGKSVILRVFTNSIGHLESFELAPVSSDALTIEQAQAFLTMARSFNDHVSWDMYQSGAFVERCFMAKGDAFFTRHRVVFKDGSFSKVKKHARTKILSVFQKKLASWSLEPAIIADCKTSA